MYSESAAPSEREKEKSKKEEYTMCRSSYKIEGNGDTPTGY